MTTSQVLFIQGGGAGAHDEWDDKMVDSLRRDLGNAYEIRYPRMPDEANPTYASWSAAIRSELSALGGGAVVVGHSVGGAILISVLAEHVQVRELMAIVLIGAPFVGAGGWTGDEFELPPDLGARLPERVPVMCFMASWMRLSRPRMPVCMRWPSQTLRCTDCLGATISSVMI